MGRLRCAWGLAALITMGQAQAPAQDPPIIDPSNLAGLTYAPPSPFVSPQPQLEQGTPPITWSLLDEPQGMAIDPNTGIFSWDYPDPIEGDLFITLIAFNDSGSDSVMVFVERLPAATIPVNPIEERTFHIAPQAGGAGASATAVLTPPPGSDYSGIVLEIPGYAEVSPSAPGRTVLTLRAADLYDRAGLGGQPFPMQSGAVFVVETRDASHTPFEFTDPVNLSVAFVHRPDPLYTDITDFDLNVGDAADMRICSDRHLGPGADFVFIDWPQQVEPAAGLVHAQGVTPLTDTEGVGVWGAVVDPHAISAEDLVDHLLGIHTLSDADRNGDGRVDVADLVTLLGE